MESNKFKERSYNHCSAYNNSKNNIFSDFKEALWIEGGYFGKFVAILLVLGISFIGLAIVCTTYCELFYCEVEFAKGDSYYVKPYEYEIEGNKIKFKSLIFDRAVEGYDFRIIEPIIKK